MFTVFVSTGTSKVEEHAGQCAGRDVSTVRPKMVVLRLSILVFPILAALLCNSVVDNF